jgi:hypothetical protein
MSNVSLPAKFNPQVYYTTEYTKFKSLNGNRDLKQSNLRRIIESFKDVYLFSPIIVNEKFQIIDGQHRFAAAQELGLPVYYIVAPGYGIKEVQILNTNSSDWGYTDYLHMYVTKKIPAYQLMQQFMEDFPDFGIKAVIKIITDNGKQDGDVHKYSLNPNDFKDGMMEIPNINLAYKNARKIMKYKPLFKKYCDNKFVSTLITLFKNKNFENDELVSRLTKNPSQLVPCASITDYKNLIEEIYNKRRSEKVSLRY